MFAVTHSLLFLLGEISMKRQMADRLVCKLNFLGRLVVVSIRKIEGIAQAVELMATDLNPQGRVFCPNPKADLKLWNSHHKGYFDMVKTGYPKCRHFGTLYELKDSENFDGGH
jgi:hypothetical protein